MRIIEGTVAEIVEYEQLAGLPPQAQQREPSGRADELGAAGAAGPAALLAGAGEEDAPGQEPAPARVVEGGLEDTDDEDAFFVRRFVYGRARSAAAARRVLDFLERAAVRGTVVEVGESERTPDGLTDYVMVRDAGPRRYGAVVYVKPANTGLTLRLRPEDVVDIDDERVKERNVRASQQYAINCPLVDDEAVELALQLTDRALGKVRGS